MEDRPNDVQVSNRRVEYAPWSPAQFIALGIGALFIIMGAVALAQTGLSINGFLDSHVNSLGFHHTGLLGAIELVFGLIMVLAGVLPGAARGTMSVLGILALGFGIVLLIQPNVFHGLLGVHLENGWLFVICGIVALAAAMIAPIIFGRDRKSTASGLEVVNRSKEES